MKGVIIYSMIKGKNAEMSLRDFSWL